MNQILKAVSAGYSKTQRFGGIVTSRSEVEIVGSRTPKSNGLHPWEAIGWLEGTFKALHRRGDVTDYGLGTALRYIQSLRDALNVAEDVLT